MLRIYFEWTLFLNIDVTHIFWMTIATKYWCYAYILNGHCSEILMLRIYFEWPLQLNIDVTHIFLHWNIDVRSPFEIFCCAFNFPNKTEKWIWLLKIWIRHKSMNYRGHSNHQNISKSFKIVSFVVWIDIGKILGILFIYFRNFIIDTPTIFAENSLETHLKTHKFASAEEHPKEPCRCLFIEWQIKKYRCLLF